jgi:hypothetical protein
VLQDPALLLLCVLVAITVWIGSVVRRRGTRDPRLDTVLLAILYSAATAVFAARRLPETGSALVPLLLLAGEEALRATGWRFAVAGFGAAVLAVAIVL